MQLGGFWLSMCIFSARGGSRNYRIGRVGGGQSLIDILIDLYLLFTECFDSTFQWDTYFQGRRRFQVLVTIGVGVGDGCAGPNIYS